MGVYWKKLSGDRWGVQSDQQLTAGQQVQVTNRAGKVSTVVIGERQNLLGFVYAIERQNPEARAQRIGDLSALLALFDKARERLQYPAIVLSVPEIAPTGAQAVGVWTVRISVAGERARVPGSLTVTEGERGDEGRDWLGRVTRDGTYTPSNKANGRTEAITKRLRDFAANPAKVAAEHGRLTGRCCFCHLKLSDERSTAVGYGATCASNYGLPWGATAGAPF
jgi:hypothetical protein